MKVNLTILCIAVFINSVQAQADSRTQSLLDSVQINRMQRDIDSMAWAGGHQSRVAFTEGSYRAAEYIARTFRAMPGVTSVQMDTFYYRKAAVPYNNYPLINIVATLQGLSAEEIVIGGHYDASCSREGSQIWNSTWSTLKVQGADDNASGVAAVIEIARVLSDPANAYTPAYTLKFIAFAAEETHPVTNDHHLGSLHDAFKRYQSEVPVKAILIMDMIAYNTVMDYMEIISNPASVWLADSVHECAENYVPTLTVNSYPYPDVTVSDHDSYQFYGFPAILLMENDYPWYDQWYNNSPYYYANPYYHKQTDTAGTLNFSLLHKTTQLALASVVLLDQPVTSIHNPLVPGNLSSNSEIHLSAFPNPFNGRTSLHVLLLRDGYVDFSIYNVAGQKIKTVLQNRYMSSGRHIISLDLEQFSSGIYFGVTESAGAKETIKFMLIQ